jgi:hypothetical protein
MKNEALRLFLAVSALILTALLTNPATSLGQPEANQTLVKQETQPAEKKVQRKVASEKSKKPKATRTFAFFFRR